MRCLSRIVLGSGPWSAGVCVLVNIAAPAQTVFERSGSSRAVITPEAEARLQHATDLIESAPDSALTLAIDWLRALPPADHGAVKARVTEIKARARLKQADIFGALDDCDSARICFRSLGDSVAIARMEQLKGEILMQAGDFTNASTHLETALNYFTIAHDLQHMAAIHRSLGSLHYFQRQFSRAWEHYHASHDLWVAAKDDNGLSRTYRSMGVLAAEDCQTCSLDRALAYTDTALHFAKRANDLAGMSAIHGNMGLMYMHMKDTAMARMHNDSAMTIAEEIGDSLLIMSTLQNLGQLAVRYGDYSRTCANCSLAFAFAERHHMTSFARDAVNCMTTGYMYQGKWREAFLSTGRYYRLRDSTYNASSREEILRRSLVAEAGRRAYSDSVANAAEKGRLQNERTIEKLRADRNRNRAVGFGIGGLMLLGVGGLLYRSDRKRRLERFERKAAQLEMQALRAQMNPHFIFNALNSINLYVQENDRELASDFLTKFARLMRLVLEKSRQAEVALAQDLEALRLYMDLERARTKEKFDYRIEVDPSIDQQKTMVPPLVLQPYVESAIWHRIAKMEGRGNILLSCRQKEEQLMMIVENDGRGRGMESTTQITDPPIQKTSLGTSITRSRLELFAEQNDGTADFRFVDLPQGFRVEVEIPMVT